MQPACSWLGRKQNTSNGHQPMTLLTPNKEGARPLHPLSVLVVDDNTTYRTGLAEYLQKQDGVRVIGQAKDGLEAVSLALTLDPDLIFMDISMPGLGGLEATKRIKQQSKETKIVFVTIHEEKTYQVLAEMLQADGFICKSSVKQDLPKVLEHIRSTMG